ncbi:4-hydroxythreonine-4-phosphate dehydrogenase PdxA [soil metagenome]
MGDVAGIGPEIIATSWPLISPLADITVVGDPARLPHNIPCVNASTASLANVVTGRVSAAAGQAAYDWLTYAIDECLAKRADGIVTCPLHKEGLHAVGVPFPGHTEILASRCGAKSHAMLLYDDDMKLAVAHVTLHMAVRDTLAHITTANVLSTIHLLNDMAPRLTGQPARIGVMALNPHAGDGGLFGDEEIRILRPAIEQAKHQGLNVDGPVPSDAAFLPHNRAKFNALAAMIHDHGHIAMKLLGGRRAVNVTAGLPIVRTSVAHGTAYDIAGKGIADASSLVSAVKVAANLV